jgi:hypothetical protein
MDYDARGTADESENERADACDDSEDARGV